VAPAASSSSASDLRQLLFLIDTAYDHVSWHGPNLRGSLRGMTLDEMHRVLRAAAAAVRANELDRGSAQRGVAKRALLTGVASHDLYHAGQIQLLKRLAKS
jgi:hypothetical protein